MLLSLPGRNPLASPELPGISSGASLSILLLFILAGPLSWRFPAALLGSLLAAALTAGGTLLIGPLSFVGLIAPQLARYNGARSVSAQIGLAALPGATLMVLADWLGRNIAWPWPVSAGILCSLIGAPWFLWQLRRR